MSSNFTNGTFDATLRPLTPNHGALLVVSFVGLVAIITFFYNCLIVVVFISDSRIRTPFNYYILNLTLADLSLALLDMPFVIHNQLILTWPYGHSLCIILQFCGWACAGAGAHAVMWISLDRMWSLYNPVHYRNHRSNRLTIAVCVGMWIYVTALTAPYIYLDQIVYLASYQVCHQNIAAQPQYTLFLEIILYTIPLTVVAIVYAVIIVKLWKRKVKVRSLKVISSRATSTQAESIIQEKTTTTETKPKVNNNQVNPIGKDSKEEERRKASEEEKSERKLFGALAWIAICMIVLWSPAIIFYIMGSYIDWVYSDTAVGIVLCLQYASCVINPFIYHRSLPDIRRAVNALLRR